jgi:MFS family permease
MMQQKNNISWLPYLLVAALFPFYAFIQMNILDVLNPYLQATLSISSEKIGSLAASYVYADAFFLIPAGFLLDRYPVNRLLLLGFSINLMGTFIFILSANFTIALMARFMAGMGHAFALISCFKLVTQWFPTRRHALLIGTIITIALCGGAAAQAPFAYLIEKFNLHTALTINIIIGCIALCVIGLFFRKIADKNNASETKRHFLENLNAAWRNPQNWLCGFYICLSSLPLMLLGAVWGATYLVHHHHLTAPLASWVTMMIFLGMIMGSPIMGWISDSIKKRKLPMMIGALFSLITTIIILMQPIESFVVLLLLFFALGFFSSAQVVGYAMIAESNSTAITSIAMGFSNVLIMAGSATFQLIFGRLLNLHAAENYSFAMPLIPLALIASLIIAMVLKETYRKEAD